MWFKKSLTKSNWVACLCLLLLFGCNANKEFADDSQVGDEVRGQIKRYYHSLNEANSKSMIFNRAIMTLDKNERSEGSLSALGQYLFSKGYRIGTKGEPLFIEFQYPHAIYSMDVDIEYPNDSLMDGDALQATETIWIDVESRLITKIKSKDFFISARTYQYEFLKHQ